MRLFLAIELPLILREKLSEHASKFLTNYNRQTRNENLHITVNFIGDVSFNSLDYLKQSIVEVCKTQEKITLFFDKILFIPNRQNPTMVWGVFKNSKIFENFADKMFDATACFSDSKLKKQKQIPHITLMRLKNMMSNEILDFNLNEKESKIECSKIHLFSSDLTSDGPNYSLIDSFNLIDKSL